MHSLLTATYYATDLRKGGIDATRIFTSLSISKTLNEFICHLTKSIHLADERDVYRQLLEQHFYNE